MKRTAIFVGSKAAYGRFQQQYGWSGENVKHVSEASQLRGLSECAIFYDRKEVQREQKWHRLLTQALEHNATYDPAGVNPWKREMASYDNRYTFQGEVYRAAARKAPEKAPEKVPAPKFQGQNTSSIWYDEKLSNQLTITTTTNTANSTHIHINPHTSITQRMLGAVKAEPKPDPLSCIWCAAVFQTEEELDLHESGCGK